MFGILFICFLLVISFFGFFYYRTYLDHYTDHAQETLSTIADLKVNSILEWKNERYGDAESVRSKPEITFLLNQIINNKNLEKSKKEILIHLSQLPFMNQYEMFVFDLQGNTVFSFHLKDAEIPQAVKLIKKEVVLTKKIALVDLYRNEISKKISPRRPR